MPKISCPTCDWKSQDLDKEFAIVLNTQLVTHFQVTHELVATKFLGNVETQDVSSNGGGGDDLTGGNLQTEPSPASEDVEFYSLADLYFDNINLASISEMEQNCVNLAFNMKGSTLTSDVKLFIESARNFHEKKELIFYMNGSCLKYQEPILSSEGLLIKQATEKCLSDLKIALENILAGEFGGCPAAKDILAAKMASPEHAVVLPKVPNCIVAREAEELDANSVNSNLVNCSEHFPSVGNNFDELDASMNSNIPGSVLGDCLEHFSSVGNSVVMCRKSVLDAAVVRSTPSTAFPTHADGPDTCQIGGTSRFGGLSPICPEPFEASVVLSKNTARGKDTTRRCRKRTGKTPKCWTCGVLGHAKKSCPQLQANLQKINIKNISLQKLNIKKVSAMDNLLVPAMFSECKDEISIDSQSRAVIGINTSEFRTESDVFAELKARCEASVKAVIEMQKRDIEAMHATVHLDTAAAIVPSPVIAAKTATDTAAALVPTANKMGPKVCENICNVEQKSFNDRDSMAVSHEYEGPATVVSFDSANASAHVVAGHVVVRAECDTAAPDAAAVVAHDASCAGDRDFDDVTAERAVTVATTTAGVVFKGNTPAVLEVGTTDCNNIVGSALFEDIVTLSNISQPVIEKCQVFMNQANRLPYHDVTAAGTVSCEHGRDATCRECAATDAATAVTFTATATMFIVAAAIQEILFQDSVELLKGNPPVLENCQVIIEPADELHSHDVTGPHACDRDYDDVTAVPSAASDAATDAATAPAAAPDAATDVAVTTIDATATMFIAAAAQDIVFEDFVVLLKENPPVFENHQVMKKPAIGTTSHDAPAACATVDAAVVDAASSQATADGPADMPLPRSKHKEVIIEDFTRKEVIRTKGDRTHAEVPYGLRDEMETALDKLCVSAVPIDGRELFGVVLLIFDLDITWIFLNWQSTSEIHLDIN